jgi:hypothetical protein
MFFRITADLMRQTAGPAHCDPPRFLSQNPLLAVTKFRLLPCIKGKSQAISEEQRAQTA